MIDQSHCATLGTPKQHGLICYLASKEGYGTLRYLAARFLDCSTSKMARRTVTVKEASAMIEWLKSGKHKPKKGSNVEKMEVFLKDDEEEKTYSDEIEAIIDEGENLECMASTIANNAIIDTLNEWCDWAGEQGDWFRRAKAFYPNPY